MQLNNKFNSGLYPVMTCLFYFIIVITTSVVTGSVITKRFHKELIQKGYAEYNPTTGVWQYKELSKQQPIVNFYREETKSPKEQVDQPLPQIIDEQEQQEGLTLIPFMLTAKTKSRK